MGYVLGSQVESMAVTDEGIEYQPAGVAHAVDVFLTLCRKVALY